MNSLRVLATRVATPASRRALSSPSAASAEAPSFKQLWMPSEVLPIVAVIGGGGALLAGILYRNALNHPDTTWSKQKKTKGVALWYEDKYPGVHGEGKPGARSAAHAH